MMDIRKIKLVWPVDPNKYKVTQGFGENPGIYARFGLAGHNGIDFGVPEGTEVKAAAPGRVMKAGNDPSGYGNYVKVDHGGYQTLYGHLRNWTFEVDDLVDAGEVIGYSDNTGFSTGPHLHFELRVPGYGAAGYRDARDASPFMVAVEYTPPPPLPILENHQNGEGGMMRVTAEYGLNLRIGPGGTIVGMLPYGAVVNVAGMNGPWNEIILFAYGDYLKPV